MKHENGSYIDLLIFSAISTVLSILSLAISARYMILSKEKVEKSILFNPGKPLSSYYSVDLNYISPSYDKYDTLDTLVDQIANYFEVFYKKAAIEKKLIDNNKFITFSAQNIAIQLSNSNKKIYTFEEFIDYVNTSRKKHDIIIPSACCIDSDVNENTCTITMKCPTIFDFNFKEKQLFSTSNVRDVKQRLIETGMPLLITYSRVKERYLVKCHKNGPYNETDSCKREDYSCGKNKDKFCVPVFFLPDGNFYNDPVFRNGGSSFVGSNESGLLVGFDDNYLPKETVNITNHALPRGGFIVKTPNGRIGHSMEYLTGIITEDQENEICPNIGDPMHWIPATLECLNNNEGNINKCGKTEMKRGKEYVYNADELVCIDEKFCSYDSKYVLIGDNVPSVTFSSEGMPQAYIAEINGSDITPKVFEDLPFQYLSRAFKLNNTKAENTDLCGFRIISYEALDNIQISGVGSWIAQSILVDFDEKSFYRSGKLYDFSYIDKSTKYVERSTSSSIVDYL